MIAIVSVVAAIAVVGGCVCYRNKQNSENEGGAKEDKKLQAKREKQSRMALASTRKRKLEAFAAASDDLDLCQIRSLHFVLDEIKLDSLVFSEANTKVRNVRHALMALCVNWHYGDQDWFDALEFEDDQCLWAKHDIDKTMIYDACEQVAIQRTLLHVTRSTDIISQIICALLSVKFRDCHVRCCEYILKTLKQTFANVTNIMAGAAADTTLSMCPEAGSVSGDLATREVRLQEVEDVPATSSETEPRQHPTRFNKNLNQNDKTAIEDHKDTDKKCRLAADQGEAKVDFYSFQSC